MKYFTTIGNCQAYVLSQFLLTNKQFAANYEYIPVSAIWKITLEEMDNVYNTILSQLDLIIIQPISENYRDNQKFSTTSILQKVPPNCIKILFPSCYFSYYQPYATYVTGLSMPCCYHDDNLINIYKNHNTSPELIYKMYHKLVTSEDALQSDYMQQSFDSNMNQIIRREKEHQIEFSNCHIIKIADFIKNNYQTNLLFYTMNHPTKHVFHYLANSTLLHLNIPLTDYPNDLDPLYYLVIPFYKSLQKYVKFDVSVYKIMLENRVVNLDQCIQEHIQVYSDRKYNAPIFAHIPKSSHVSN